MEKPDEKVLERIRRLLAMAEDASSPNEAAIAATRARKLLEKYNLDHTDSILKDLKDDGTVDKDLTTNITINKKGKNGVGTIPVWANVLSVAVAALFDCHVRATNDWKTGAPGLAITFFGYKTDLIACKWTFEFLVDQYKRFNRQARAYWASSEMDDYRKGLLFGMVDVLDEAILNKRQAENKAQQSSTGTALVPVEKHLAIQQKFGEFNYQKVETQSTNLGAYLHGHEDGRSVQLHQPLEGSKDQGKLE